LKLLYITNSIYGAGGLERVLSIKATYLVDKLGYEIHIITLNQKGLPLFYNFSNKILHHDLRVTGNIFEYFKSYKRGLKDIIKKINPDIISVCDDGLKGFFLPYILGKPCAMIYERHASKNIFKTSDSPNYIQKIKFKIINILMHLLF